MLMAGKHPKTSRHAVPVLALALALAVVSGPGCASYIGTTATSFLHRIRDDRDPNIRYLAYTKLANPNCFDGEPQKIEAVEVLGSALLSKKEPAITRAVICRTLGEIGRPEAREPLLRMIDDPEPVIRAAACRALGKVGKPDDAVVLSRLMVADQDPDCRIAAIEGIRTLHSPDPRITVVLVDAMENSDPAIRLAAYEALQTTTGQDLGPDPKAWEALAQNPDRDPATPSSDPTPSPAPAPANPSPALTRAPAPAAPTPTSNPPPARRRPPGIPPSDPDEAVRAGFLAPH